METEKPTIPVPPMTRLETVTEDNVVPTVPELGVITAAEVRASHGKKTRKPKTRACVCGCGVEIPATREFAPGHLKALHSRVKTLVVQFRTFQTPIDLPDMALRYATERGWLA